MQIAAYERVTYTQSPLADVICQIRFSRILALEQTSPVEFQETFAKLLYPDLDSEHPNPELHILREDGNESVQSPVTARIFHFSSLDKNWKLSICADFIALSCKSYSGWEEFKKRFTDAFLAFFAIYSFPVAKRLDLRYRDVIERHTLGLAGVPWHELLAPFVIGILGAKIFIDEDSSLDPALTAMSSQTILQLKSCKLSLNTAYLTSVDDQDQQAFLIDSDFFIECNESYSGNASFIDQFELMHRSAGALFRHCITEKLHDALGPIPIDGRT